MVESLASFSGFVYVLVMALSHFNADMLNAMPKLSEFIDHLTNLASMLAKLGAADIAGMVVGLAALAGFVYVLSMALNQLNPDMLDALPNLSQLIDSLSKLAQMLAGLGAWDIVGMAVGLALLAGFVYALSAAIAMIGVDALNALPSLTGLIDILMKLSTAL